MYKVNYGIKNDQTFFKNILITKINKAKFCSNSFQNLAFYICMKSMLTQLVLIKPFYKTTSKGIKSNILITMTHFN
jgi:hypothetical protein